MVPKMLLLVCFICVVSSSSTNESNRINENKRPLLARIWSLLIDMLSIRYSITYVLTQGMLTNSLIVMTLIRNIMNFIQLTMLMRHILMEPTPLIVMRYLLIVKLVGMVLTHSLTYSLT